MGGARSLTAKAGEVVSKERLIAEVFSYDDAVAPNALEVHYRAAAPPARTGRAGDQTMRGLGYMLKAS